MIHLLRSTVAQAKKHRLVGVASVVLSVVLVVYFSADSASILSRGSTDDGGQYVEILSKAFDLDRTYLSMQGPRSNQSRLLLDTKSDKSDMLWLTAVETTNVDAESNEPVSDEFFCHSNLTFCPNTWTPEQHNAAFTIPKHMEWRLFTLVPGRMNMTLPPGFGIPVRGDVELDYFTMALNQNPGPKHRTRMKTRICYKQDDANLKPLFRRALYVYQQHQEVTENTKSEASHVAKELKADGVMAKHQGEECAESCNVNLLGATASTFAASSHPGASCCVENASADGITKQFGPDNTAHWMVPPGAYEYRTEVSKQLKFPFDTTVHYATGHLHPFGTELRLVDLDTGETLITINSEDYRNKRGVKYMTEIRSEAGIPLRHDGRYQLVASYQNTTAENIDAMGIMYLYSLDAADPRSDSN